MAERADQKTIDRFLEDFNGLFDRASKQNIPTPYIEAACRDALAGIEAMRLGPALVHHMGLGGKRQ